MQAVAFAVVHFLYIMALTIFFPLHVKVTNGDYQGNINTFIAMKFISNCRFRLLKFL